MCVLCVCVFEISAVLTVQYVRFISRCSNLLRHHALVVWKRTFFLQSARWETTVLSGSLSALCLCFSQLPLLLFSVFPEGRGGVFRGRLSSPLLFCTPEKRRKQTERRKKGRGMVRDGSCNSKNEQCRWIILYWMPAVLGFLPEAESQEKHGVWDPVPELTITSPYVRFRVDSNTFTMGNPICQSRLYPPVRDFEYGLRFF